MSYTPVRNHLALVATLAITALCSTTAVRAEDPWVTYEPARGPGNGKHIVLVSGDEEYRSEEALPMLAKILARRHGFKCTVLFAINPDDGTIDPNNQTNIPGLHQLEQADLMVIATRYRELPDDQMKYIVDYVNSGKPIIGLRTATHAFRYDRHKDSPYADYDFRNERWTGGFGQQVLGDTWINHHGRHKKESTRGIVNKAHAELPILRGVDDIWGPTDVYGIQHLPSDATVLVFGQVLEGMEPTDKPVADSKNDPMMPLAWVKTYAGETGQTSRVFCTTMGAAVDFESEGLRRLFVNACYWGVGLEDKIPASSNVDYVDPYDPTFYATNKFKEGARPEDYRLEE